MRLLPPVTGVQCANLAQVHEATQGELLPQLDQLEQPQLTQLQGSLALNCRPFCLKP